VIAARPRTWILGAGGQIGSRLLAHLPATSVFSASQPPWEDLDALHSYFDQTAQEFAAWQDPLPWRVIWLAGRAVVSSSEDVTNCERRSFQSFVEALSRHKPASKGVVFVGSSAGGVYAGSSAPPFNTATQPLPTTPYGRLKLDQEIIAARALAHVTPVIIGRLANVYGPTQKLTKPQGLITRLCQAAVTRRPLNIYVPADTLRDYVYVDDITRAIDFATRSNLDDPNPIALSIELLASGRAVSIARVINVVQSVTHRRLPLAFGTDVHAAYQPRDLRLAPSRVMFDANPIFTSLHTGARRVFDSMVTAPLSPTPA